MHLKLLVDILKNIYHLRNVLKMATTNVSKAIDIDSGVIKEGYVADILMVKQLSKNPWLSIINRTESKNIICLIRKGKIVYMR